MGERTVMQEALFYEFSIERHVPSDHLLRSIDRFVDLSELRPHLRPFYSESGALDRSGTDDPDADRRLLLRHPFRVTPVRGGASQSCLSLVPTALPEGDVPDHSTFSKNRHGRFRDSDMLRELFETTVRRCIEEGLVGNEGFADDASLIRADANRRRSAEGLEQSTGRQWRQHAAQYRSIAGRCRVGSGERGEAEVRSEVRTGGARERSRGMLSSPTLPTIRSTWATPAVAD